MREIKIIPQLIEDTEAASLIGSAKAISLLLTFELHTANNKYCMSEEKHPRQQQLDAMVATINNVLRLPSSDRKQRLIEATIETLNANQARGEITHETKELMLSLLCDGPHPPDATH